MEGFSEDDTPKEKKEETSSFRWRRPSRATRYFRKTLTRANVGLHDTRRRSAPPISSKADSSPAITSSENVQLKRRASLQVWLKPRVVTPTKREDEDTREQLLDTQKELMKTTTSIDEKSLHEYLGEAVSERTHGLGLIDVAQVSMSNDESTLIETNSKHHNTGEDSTFETHHYDTDHSRPMLVEGGDRLDGTIQNQNPASWGGTFYEEQPAFEKLLDEENSCDRPANTGGKDPREDEELPRHVKFLSTTMGLTVDISSRPSQETEEEGAFDGESRWPASPCSGMILENSPRYSTLQTFRKEMSLRGINVKLFHSGWKRRLLPPNNIRLFMTDTRQNSILYWRYRRGGGSKLREDLGAEDRRVIPLSSLANIGPAELKLSAARHEGYGILSSSASWSKKNKQEDKKKKMPGKATTQLIEIVPTLALSYWVEGKPRWVGDKPKRLLVKTDSLNGFRSLGDGLRLCCLHFHNYACPQDLEDTC